MKVSIFSFFMATIFGSVLSIMTYRMRKKNLYSGRAGIAGMVLLYLFGLARMLVPVDFPFTQGIYLDKGITWIYDEICLKRYGNKIFSISIMEFMIVIWLCIACILLTRFLCNYHRTWEWVRKMNKKADKRWENRLEKVMEKRGRKVKVGIYRCGQVKSPMGMGIKNRLILLPDKEYKEKDLYYILLHEYTHFLNHDLLIKMAVQVYCCIFWWNPTSHFLRKDLEQSLEIKCDLCVTQGMDRKDISDYLQTIVNAIKGMREWNGDTSHGTAALAKGEKSEIIERFRIIAENQKNVAKKRVIMFFWSVMFLVALALSYSVIPLPAYEPIVDEIETGPNTYELSPENSYILEDGEGGYRWVMDGVMDDEISKELAMELENEGFQIRRKK